MNFVLPVTFLFISLFILTVNCNKEEENKNNNTQNTLPKCPHIDPYFDIEGWSKVSANLSGCDPVSVKPKENIENEKEKERYSWGEKKFAYDMIASDKIGPKRDLPPMYHELCENISYEGLNMDASIVIVYHNEALSVLIRMINSILDRTPQKYLKEIILFDDFSEDENIISKQIQKYANLERWPINKIIIKRSDERLGLIRAKTLASRMATGEVLIFLDSHCEVTPLWIEPLLAAIRDDPKRVVVPVVDIIHPATFEYSKAMVAKVGFDWSLRISWKYFPWEYFDIPENNYKPFSTPVMSGGLLAIKKSYFHEMGEYDINMEIWGAENIEMSVRMWLCGGSVVVAPCSRVGHVFRMIRPYKSKPGLDSNLYNSLRTVKVWFDDYDKYFYYQRPRAQYTDSGDVSERIELKKRLSCKPFEYFLKEIDTEMVLPTLKDEL